MIKNLSKNQKILLIASAVLLVIILILFLTRTASQKTDEQSLDLSTSGETKFSLPDPSTRPKATSASSLSQQAPDSFALVEKKKLLPLLPLYLKAFPTSVGINTDISIFTLVEDPPASIHLEIYNVDFQESIASKDNPNVVAFAESLIKTKAELATKGINLKNLQIIYNNRQFAQDTALNWVHVFKLLD